MEVTMVFKTQLILILGAVLTACGGGGGGGSPDPQGRTNTAPVVNAGSDQEAQELSQVILFGSATDDSAVSTTQWAQVAGPQVSLSTANELSTSFTAPSVTVDTILSFELTATDDQTLSSTDSVNITVTAIVDGPTVNAGADQSATSGNTVTLNANLNSGEASSYLWQGISGNEGIVLTADNTQQVNFVAPFLTIGRVAIFEVTVINSQGQTSQDQVSVTIVPGSGSIAGLVKYENVPHTDLSALDYANTTQDPVRGIDVELIDATTINSTPIILATTKTNSLGEYNFTDSASGKSVIVRVKSTYTKVATTLSPASWDMQVIDNTNANAIYALDTSAFIITPSNITKNLTALSGWNTTDNDYTSPRAAAPFHILDRAYDMVNKIITADADVVIPEVKLNWSINNRPAAGEVADGNIGTSYYSNGNLYILGAKDSDTDEYDGHVVLHELGHYFEDKFSRADSIGGSHSFGDRLDMRVAFGEGFGNAWSAIISDDPFYRDSSGSKQDVGFHISMEENSVANAGWYSESSVQSILYDIYDSTNESNDAVSLGFTPIYNVLTGVQKVTPALTSIFSFGTAIKAENISASTDIDALLTAQDIVGSTMDIYGSTETNDANNSNVLDIYTSVNADGVASDELCSIATFSPTPGGNKLSTYRFVKFLAESSTSYTFTVTPSGADSGQSDPVMIAYHNGVKLEFIDNYNPGSAETFTLSNANEGIYTFAISHFPNYAGQSSQSTGCFTFSAVQN